MTFTEFIGSKAKVDLYEDLHKIYDNVYFANKSYIQAMDTAKRSLLSKDINFLKLANGDYNKLPVVEHPWPLAMADPMFVTEVKKGRFKLVSVDDSRRSFRTTSLTDNDFITILRVLLDFQKNK